MILLIIFLNILLSDQFLKIEDINLLMIKIIRMLTTFTPLGINLSGLYVQFSQTAM